MHFEVEQKVYFNLFPAINESLDGRVFVEVSLATGKVGKNSGSIYHLPWHRKLNEVGFRDSVLSTMNLEFVLRQWMIGGDRTYGERS